MRVNVMSSGVLYMLFICPYYKKGHFSSVVVIKVLIGDNDCFCVFYLNLII